MREHTCRGVPSRLALPKRRQGFQGLAADDFGHFVFSPYHCWEEALAVSPDNLAAPDFDRIQREFRAYAGDWVWGAV